MTIGELRLLCQNRTAQQELAHTDDEISPTSIETAINKRIKFEKEAEQNPFALLAHKPNYIILSNNLASPNEQPFNDAFPNEDAHFQPWETKFQISLKVPVIRGLFGKADLFAGYTNRSFWQQFNKVGSSPFRDSNHELETWLSFNNDSEFLGFRNRVIRTGIVHQSNGQSGVLSRSWNRVYADFIFERHNWYLSLKPWWRIPEDNDEDDNPDIDDYLGHFELSGVYKKDQHSFDFMVRNNLKFGDNHGALQLGWSFPLSKNVRGYVQWFNGYGESLIDYDSYSNSLGFGFQLADWL
ncbi:MAG: phospholipase [Methylophaga sp.]|nr:MAG: phospholipase [Methylophaga sp.]